MFQILRKLLLDTATVARADLGLLKRFPRLAWVLPAIVVIPALYAFIYLDSVWDPASRTGALPVAIVNLDEGAAVADQRFELGRELVHTLRAAATSTTSSCTTPPWRARGCVRADTSSR